MFNILNAVATGIGYVAMTIVFGIAVLLISRPVWSYFLYRNSSQEAKQMATELREEGYDTGIGAYIFDEMIQAAEDLGIDAHSEYEPKPVATVDWSVDNPPSVEVNVMRSALEDAGYHTHPFPQEREGDWSRRHVGVWKTKPTFYVVSEETDEKIQVQNEPDAVDAPA